MTNTRSRMSDEQKARLYAALHASDWNVKGTAREVGMNHEVVRYWAKKWQVEPPSREIMDLAVQASEDFVVLAGKIRDDALRMLHAKLDDASPRDLVTIVGVLSDKVRIAQGLATQRVETVNNQVDYKALAAGVEGLVKGMIQSAREREQDIIEVTDVEEATDTLGLPSPQEN